jgi:hypothetical protein
MSSNIWVLKKRLKSAREMLKEEFKKNENKRNKKKINSLYEGMQNLRVKIKRMKNDKKGHN